MKLHATLSSAICLLLTAATAHAATLRVPDDFPTVQGAVDAAEDGDTIRIGPSYVGLGFDIDERRDLSVIGEEGHTISSRITVSGSAAVELRDLRVLFGDIEVTNSIAVTVKRSELYDAGIFVDGSENVSIDRNEIRKAPSVAIALSDSRGFSVKRNVVLSPQDDAITVSGSGSVKANLIEGDTQGTAIVLAGSGGVDVLRNEISKIQGIAVRIDEGSGHQVVGNVITMTGADAIRCNKGDSNRFEGNRLKLVRDGFDIREDCNENEVLNNRIKTAFADGIDVASIGNSILGNVIKGAFDLGIELGGTRNIVEDNTIKGALDQEIRDDGTGNQVRDNTCLDYEGGFCN